MNEGTDDMGSAGEADAKKKARIPRPGRGFASMDPAKQREIASKGGKAAHEKGTGHEWTVEQAREAGRKGGKASMGGRRSVLKPEPVIDPVEG